MVRISAIFVAICMMLISVSIGIVLFAAFGLNAAEAMIKGGCLTIRSVRSTDGSSIVITFADTGHGIPEEVRERIFDPFYTTKEHGTGLGLSISYGIIEQHGGTIGVDSITDKGSTFTISLPILTSEGSS